MMDKTSEKKSLKRKHQAPFKSPFQKDSACRSTGAGHNAVWASGVGQQTLEELKEKLETVDREVEELKSQGMKENELQTHIDKLHEYNEMKDTGQLVLGRLANLEGVTTKDLYQQYGLDLED